MAFIARISTEEDKIKFNLDSVKKKYGPFASRKYGLAIDQEREAVLLKVYSGSPRTDDPDEHHFALIVNQNSYLFKLEINAEEKSNNEFHFTWNLLSSEVQPDSNDRSGYLKQLLKESLSVYGMTGPSFFGVPTPKFHSEFSF